MEPAQRNQLSSVLGTPSMDIEACKEAFMAVLASVCDPHLNTIHAVCQKFSQGRGSSFRTPALNAPRSIDRSLHLNSTLDTYQTQSVPPVMLLRGVGNSAGLDFGFDNLTPLLHFVPCTHEAGPLSIPLIEPPHPIVNIEMDSLETWRHVCSKVDIGHCDLLEMAGRLAKLVRCYGFGPVLLKVDVTAICHGE